jgi:hypothetical protein
MAKGAHVIAITLAKHKCKVLDPGMGYLIDRVDDRPIKR